MKETTVIIVGAGPSGLATAACLTQLSIPYVLLERDDCYASLWKKRTYDRVRFHLPKESCQLPHMPYPSNYPKYVPRKMFIQYLDNYVDHFNIKPLCQRPVENAKYDQGTQKWRVVAKNITNTDEVMREEYVGRFLVVACGATTDPKCPEIQGMSSFPGKVVHTTQYKNGKEYEGKNVLVIGAGNSGMEIALDLVNHGAIPSVVVRSPVHVISRRMIAMMLFLQKYLPLYYVDKLAVMHSKLVYGDVSKYGIIRPSEGPFYRKNVYGKYPFIDIGSFDKIKSGEIQVLPEISEIRGNDVEFQGGKSFAFDAVIFATGFKRSTKKWLEGDDYLLNEFGMPKPKNPNHWKGRMGLYCVGLSRRGLYGISSDAQNISGDIKESLYTV